jgi:hypothetical protein
MASDREAQPPPHHPPQLPHAVHDLPRSFHHFDDSEPQSHCSHEPQALHDFLALRPKPLTVVLPPQREHVPHEPSQLGPEETPLPHIVEAQPPRLIAAKEISPSVIP